MQRCGLCRFYSAHLLKAEALPEERSEFGECRRYPEMIEKYQYNWCGEFKSATAAKKAAAFIPPTIREIRDYCTEIESQADPAQIFNHYTANGWIRGKTKMKDWKAAVRGWSSREGR